MDAQKEQELINEFSTLISEEEAFYKKQLKINREEMKKRKKVKKVVKKVSKDYNIDNFLSKKPTVSNLVKFLSERYDEIDRTDPNEIPLIITALNQLDKEAVIDYLNKKGVLKDYYDSSAFSQELLEVELRNKYVKPKKKVRKVVKKVVKKEEPKKEEPKKKVRKVVKKVVKKEEPKKEEPKKKKVRKVVKKVVKKKEPKKEVKKVVNQNYEDLSGNELVELVIQDISKLKFSGENYKFEEIKDNFSLLLSELLKKSNEKQIIQRKKVFNEFFTEGLDDLEENESKYSERNKKGLRDLKKIMDAIYSKDNLNVANLTRQAEIFYKNLNDYLRGSKRQINYLRSLNPLITEEQIKKIFEGQQYKDFFPTPVKCLELFDFGFTNNLLEGTAGLGSVVHYINNKYPEINLSANELDEEFSKIVKVYNPSVNVMNKDFLKLKPENKYDGIFLNPPFSKFGRGGKNVGMKGGKRPFYFEFLYKALTLLKDLGQPYQKTIYFISPAIVKGEMRNDESFYVEEFLRNANLGKDYMKEIHKKYFGKELKDKDLKELKEGEKDIGNIEGFEDTPLENIRQIQRVGTCSGFGGTNAKAEMYEIIVY